MYGIREKRSEATPRLDERKREEREGEDTHNVAETRDFNCQTPS